MTQFHRFKDFPFRVLILKDASSVALFINFQCGSLHNTGIYIHLPSCFSYQWVPS